MAWCGGCAGRPGRARVSVARRGKPPSISPGGKSSTTTSTLSSLALNSSGRLVHRLRHHLFEFLFGQFEHGQLVLRADRWRLYLMTCSQSASRKWSLPIKERDTGHHGVAEGCPEGDHQEVDAYLGAGAEGAPVLEGEVEVGQGR